MPGARIPSSLLTRMCISPRPRPGRGASPRLAALQHLEHVVHFLPQFVDRLGAHRAARRPAQLAGPAVLLDLLSRPLDRVLLGVQQVLDQHDQLDLAALVDAVAGAVLGRIEEPELALPIAEDVRLEVRQRAHLADREELLGGPWMCHRHCSALRVRSMRSATAWRGALPSKRMAATCAVIGSSTPCRSASPTAERAVFTPSATVRCVAVYCSSRSPLGQRHAERPVAAEAAGGRQDQVAHAGQPRKGHRLRPHGQAEPGHLGEPAGDERRARVVAQAQSLQDPRRDGDHVLERAAELDADQVVVRVDPELRRREGLLHHRGHRRRPRRRPPPRSAGPRGPPRRSSARRAPRPGGREALSDEHGVRQQSPGASMPLVALTMIVSCRTPGCSGAVTAAHHVARRGGQDDAARRRPPRTGPRRPPAAGPAARPARNSSFTWRR